jgi:PTH1 family peptidyl-tRNA hydrolase
MNKFLLELGNIGAEYETHATILVKILDYFAKKNNFHFKPSNWVPLQNTNLKEEPFPLKPNTYMNLSGKAILILDGQENISLENIFVITDDLNLSFSTIRSSLKEAMEYNS